MIAGVPSAYRGLWRRTFYGEPGGVCDTVSEVVWLQGPLWHADLRLPRQTPDFSGVTRLADCSREQLVWLAGLTAFAGLTQVEGAHCTWHRYFDLNPTLERDTGLMTFLGENSLEERHPYGRYRECWERQAGQVGEGRLVFDGTGRLLWLQLGEHAMAVAHRPSDPSREPRAAATPFAPLGSLDDAALRWRASLRFDYLQYSPEGRSQTWKVLLSTHPWRRGIAVMPPLVLPER